MGVSRDTFYSYKEAYDEGGLEAILVPTSTSKSPLPLSHLKGF